jgi:hypothetical protein
MSKYFSVRHALNITIADQSHTFYIRELSFSRFKEINDSTGTSATDNERGLLLLKKLVLEAVEEEDGSKSYDEASWNDELQSVVNQLGKAVMKAQGIDMDAAKAETPLTPEQSEGNAEPSRKSGANSQSSSAAPSENSKAA